MIVYVSDVIKEKESGMECCVLYGRRLWILSYKIFLLDLPYVNINTYLTHDIIGICYSIFLLFCIKCILIIYS